MNHSFIVAWPQTPARTSVRSGFPRNDPRRAVALAALCAGQTMNVQNVKDHHASPQTSSLPGPKARKRDCAPALMRGQPSGRMSAPALEAD
jgi:hypothetical protein